MKAAGKQNERADKKGGSVIMNINGNYINQRIKAVINSKGFKMTKISEVTGIEYQRLNRMLNQNAVMAASELLILCSFLEIDPREFMSAA